LLIKTKLISFIYDKKFIRYSVFKYSASALTETGHLNAEQQRVFKRATAAGIKINFGKLKLPPFQKFGV
jgi:hypothetical protein